MAGVVGYVLTVHHVVGIVDSYADAIAPSRHARFMAAVFAHVTSYVTGSVGAVLAGTWALKCRRRVASRLRLT